MNRSHEYLDLDSIRHADPYYKIAAKLYPDYTPESLSVAALIRRNQLLEAALDELERQEKASDRSKKPCIPVLLSMLDDCNSSVSVLQMNYRAYQKRRDSGILAMRNLVTASKLHYFEAYPKDHMFRLALRVTCPYDVSNSLAVTGEDPLTLDPNTTWLGNPIKNLVTLSTPTMDDSQVLTRLSMLDHPISRPDLYLVQADQKFKETIVQLLTKAWSRFQENLLRETHRTSPFETHSS